MINPRDMYDRDIIVELQGWPVFFGYVGRLDENHPTYDRYLAVAREFERRMGYKAGTMEQIEEERARAQRVAARMSTPKKPTANDTGYVQTLEFTLEGSPDALHG